MGEGENGRLRFDFDDHPRLGFRGAKVSKEAESPEEGELEGALGMTQIAVMAASGELFGGFFSRILSLAETPTWCIIKRKVIVHESHLRRSDLSG
ncbi:MAG: hypothetical protein SWK76_08740 [Actinomycetota bacterium]|nr:hypothetical protein [Actinomycetota bacterium]